ncbi:hypothetical protein [Desulfonatronum lacustre]|uniref:hypothetical protein n=1 Tax=Desulfonatronum lacustre TaxID=66849 RepID=UPI0004B56159|nr:hypothetical protein [Desulfonatronum lacustre]SMP38991.1 Uncharacterized membrane protein [Desulfonatronum zhilinae]
MELSSVVELLFTAQGPSEWAHWPFGPSFVGSWLNMLTKFVFIGLVLALMMYLLRYLFGPGGPMRDEGLDASPDEQVLEQALAVLRKRMMEGRIEPEDFERARKLMEQ